MKTFTQEVKDKYVARVKAHADADKIVKGKYWENGKGCAVGCTIEGNEHERYETEMGIPRAIARLEDRIFEGLPNEIAMKFPLRFIESVPTDTDLSMVVPRFFIWLLGDEKDGVIKHVQNYKKCKLAIETVVDLYKRTVGGEVIEKQAWRDARTAAYADAAAYAAADAAAYAAADAAAYAAYAAAAAYADAAAYAAADAAAYAAYAAAAAYADAAYAADAAAYADAAAARRTTRENMYVKMADKLIELIKEAK